MPFDSIPARFRQWRETLPNKIAYGYKENGVWVTATWSDYVYAVDNAALSLLQMGISKGDKVAIYATNRPQWTIVDMAAMSIGAVSVGIYSTSSPEQVEYILQHSEARMVFTDTPERKQKVLTACKHLSGVRIVGMTRDSDGVAGVTNWELFDSLATGQSPSNIHSRVQSLRPSDPAMLVYTSGTTGTPRAVVLTHDQILACTVMGVEMIEDKGPRHSALSYLPLAHIAERGISVLGPSLCGYSIYFVQDAKDLKSSLLEVRPTIVLGVPRMWEKMSNLLQDKFEEASPAKWRLLEWARSIVYNETMRLASGNQHRKGIRYRIANKLVITKIKHALGLDRAETLITGAAPISDTALHFFASLGLCIREAYGLSESAGVISFNRPGKTIFGTVGQAFDGIEIRIADDGEILARGKNIFSAYLKDGEATSEMLKDGWLCTGDMGELSDEGYLTITGRKKDLIITSGGKNISPAGIEELLKSHPKISSAIVVGDNRPYLTAILVPDFDVVETADRSELAAEVASHVMEINKRLARAQGIKKYHLLDRRLEAERKELTPTLKVRRNEVINNLGNEIESMYV